MKTCLHRLLPTAILSLSSLAQPLLAQTMYDKSQYKESVDVKISQPYTPFGNRPEFNRYGDDGSKCVLDANGVLTWIGNQGEVRLLPDSSKGVPLFVTNTECLVWVNRFVDYNTYPDRPDAQLRLYRSTPESNAVTSQDVSFQGKEIIDTPQVTTTTGTLTFVSATRKDNGDETPVPLAANQNNSDDCDLRFYRLTFDAGVQFVGAKTLPIRAVPDFATNVVGANASSFGYGSDGSLAIRIPEVQTNPKEIPAKYELNQTYWIDSQGRFLRVQADDTNVLGHNPQAGTAITGTAITSGVDIDRALFVSNTRLLFEHSGSSQGIQEQRRSSSTGSLLPSSTKDLTASVSGTVLDIWNYSQAGVNRYFYTVDTTGTIINTYTLTANGISPPVTTTLTGGLTISPATMTGTVNTNDGSALLAIEDGDALIWLHSAAPGYTALPNSSQASALFVTNDQAVIWENTKAPVGGNGQIPNAIVKHYKQVGTVPTLIRTDGNKTLLNTSRLTPDPEYWFITTAIKTDASTSRLTTYKLDEIEIANVDTDKDGLLDYYETNTGTFVSATDTGTNPNLPDTDSDGLEDNKEILVHLTDPTKSDTDNDGLTDGVEVANGSDPKNDKDPKAIDTDNDNLTDFAEIYVHFTDPKITDTDNDGLNDDLEVLTHFTDPNVMDTDDDGFTDFVEVTATPATDPNDASSTPPYTPLAAYNKSQFVNQIDVKIPQPYTPFGNRPEFNRFGDDGSKCVLDANGVLTWVGNQGEVRLLPDTSKAIPLFVTNTECLVWVNRFVDYVTYPERPNAQLRLYRSTPGSTQVSFQDVSFEGKEIIDTPQVTTTTGTLTFVSATRKDNGDETPGPNNFSDDCELRFYRLTFDAGVQFVGTRTVQIKNVEDFETNAVGPEIQALGYGSDGSMAIKVMNERVQPGFKNSGTPDYEGRTYWIDNQGRFVRVIEDQLYLTNNTLDPKPCSRVLFMSNTRMVYEHTTTAGVIGIQEQRRSSSNGNLLPASTKDLTASVTGTTLDIWNYSQVGTPRNFYTVNTTDEVAGTPDDKGTIIRTYRVNSDGVSFVRQATLLGGLTISPAAATGTVNAQDGSALLVSEDGDALIWLHAAGYTNLPNSSRASALFVTDQQAVIWENGKAPVGEDGKIPPAVVMHYNRAALSATPANITSASQVGTTVSLQIKNHGFAVGDSITITGLTGTTPANGTFAVASVTSPNNLTYRLNTSQTATFGVGAARSDYNGTRIVTDGNTALLNTSRLTPTNPEFWLFTTATKTDASTSRLVTYRLGTVEIKNPTIDSDGDGVTDNDELNIYNTNPLATDSDGDGLSDLTELLVLFTNANDPVGTGFMTPSVPDENANNSSYEGLLYGEQTGLVGKVTFNVTGTTPKTFTGTYQDIYGASCPLQGTFDGSGELATFSSSLELDLADINIVLQNQPNNKYHIHLAINTGANGMQYAKARPALDTYAPLRSKLTFEAKLSNAESVPSGAAIATGTLTTAAEANFQIYLPDGSTSAYAGKILDGEIIALHTKSASTGAPSFLGNLKLDNRSNQISNLSGATRLFSDASDYDQVRELTGSYYQVPLTTSLPLSSFTPGTSNSVFGWSQGELGGAYQVVSWTPIGITPPTTAYDSMTPTFTPSTGLMKVDYIRSDRDRNLYQDKSTAWAVVNQGRSTVNGFYTGSAGRNWVGGSFSVIPNTTRLTPPDVPLPPEPPIIPGIVSSITPTSKSVGAALSTYEITVNGTDNWQVEIPETAPWISAEVVSNDGSTWADKLTGRGSAKITVTVQANDDFSNREAVIKIGNLEKGYLEHKITQSAGTVTSINPTSMQAVTEGNAYTIRVLATGTWRAVVSTPAWIKAEVVNDNGFVPAATGTGGGTGAASNLVGQGNATINVTIDPNATPNMRTGSILIGDKTHSVTQRPVFLAGTVTSISSTSRNVAATASTYTFRVTGKDNWRTVVTGGSWLKAEVINDDGYVAAGNLTGSGNATIKVTVAANSTVNRRTGTIKVGDKVHTVVQAPIIERGSVTSINPTKRDVRAAQTSYTIRVTGVKNWTISIPAGSSGWITAKVVNNNGFIYAAAPNVTGSGNATIQVTVATNATNKRRTGTINIGGKIHTINQAFR
jgi:hypothetical protein